jgi:hypothetical protein
MVSFIKILLTVVFILTFVAAEECCKETYVYNPTSKKCICPPEAKYDNGSTCVACDTPHIWDSIAKVCGLTCH